LYSPNIRLNNLFYEQHIVQDLNGVCSLFFKKKKNLKEG
jgi:hypothetical protein